MRALSVPLMALGLSSLAPAAAQDAPRVVIIATDDPATARQLGPFGASYRAHHADLIRALDQAGARAIGFTASFPESPKAADGTAAMARAIQASRAPVVLNAGLRGPGPDGALTPVPTAAGLQDSGARVGPLVAAREFDPAEPGEAEPGEQLLLPQIDGQDSLPIVLAAAAYGVPPDKVAAMALDASEPAPILRGGQTGLVIRPPVEPTRVRSFGYADVLAGKVPPEALEGAVVLVGSTRPIAGWDSAQTMALARALDRVLPVARSYRDAAPARPPAGADSQAKPPTGKGFVGQLGD